MYLFCTHSHTSTVSFIAAESEALLVTGQVVVKDALVVDELVSLTLVLFLMPSAKVVTKFYALLFALPTFFRFLS